MQRLLGQAPTAAHAVPALHPPRHTPAPWHCESSVHGVPALAPPIQVPPSSHSSPGSGTPFPQVAEGCTQPVSALFTETRISSIVMLPSPSLSPAVHAVTGALPRATLTMVSRLSTVTSFTLLQSPTHTARAGDAVRPRINTAVASVTHRVPQLVVLITDVDDWPEPMCASSVPDRSSSANSGAAQSPRSIRNAH